MSENDTLFTDKVSPVVDRAITGDRDALGELLLRYEGHLRRYVARRLPAHLKWAIEVDDVIQETFAVAVREITCFRPRGSGSFAGWLRTIAASRLVDMIRACRRKKRGGDFRRVDRRTLTYGSMIDLLDLFGVDENTPFHAACRAEEALRANVALAGLPVAYRTAIRLRYLEGRTMAEVAVALERSHTAIAGLLKRSKEKLRQVLSKDCQHTHILPDGASDALQELAAPAGETATVSRAASAST